MKGIKPCPFCGDTPTIKYKYGDYGYTPDTAHISCCIVHLSGPTEKWEQGRGHYSVKEETTNILIDRWNKRYDE